MRPNLLPSFLLVLLAAPAAYSQAPFRASLWDQPYWRDLSRLPSPTSTIARMIVMQPSIPIGADGLLKTEPDSTTRNLYARNKVRTVLKVRLDQEGTVLDTVEYQAVDRLGRWEQVGTSPTQIRRQWSYNAAGQCTALIEFPFPTRPYTVINTYNPALQQSQQEVLQSNGTRTVVSERKQYRSGDTLLTEIRGQELTVKQYFYPEYFQRSLLLRPHPDTVLVLTGFYNQKQKLTSYQTDYLLYQQGRLIESGALNTHETSPIQPVKSPVETPVLPAPDHALTDLRRSRRRQPQRQHYYDKQHHLIRQEATSLLSSGVQTRTIRNVVTYTYNNLGQLIGRQGSLTTSSVPIHSGYTVFSYLPTGLLQGETSNARSAKPVFYRYQYEYFE